MRKEIHTPDNFNREQLLEYVRDLAKRWLAHDGLWFLAVEKKYGIKAAMEMDMKAWERFTVLEAKRIMDFLDMKPGGGIDALQRAFSFRLYAHLNEQSVERPDEGSLILTMKTCRVQEARKRKRLPDFHCKSIGFVEYSQFAKAIDEEIATECIFCPPDKHPDDAYCCWRFTENE
ncbi:MAG: DUF6125 family protein [Acidobacteriota bacterium]